MRYSDTMSSCRPLTALAVVSIFVAACAGPAVVTPAPSGAEPSPSTSLPSVAAPPACPTDPVPPPASAGRWADRVFYEVFVRSFADSDADGIGDLAGLTERLDYLNDGDPATTDDLGVTALWLMPIAESPSYHGYDVTDYRAVDPDYGTNDDFRALVAAARDRGIEIIVDLVMNHTSVEHPWFQDARTPGSEHDPWYVWADEHPAFAGPGGRPVWHAEGDRWYYGYFWDRMPDLDVTLPAVTAELDDIARFWVDDMGAAGFRLDAARHLIEDGTTLENTPATFDWLRGFRERLHAADPEALVLGEVWDSTTMASRYVRDGALDLVFDFDLAAQFLLAVRSGDGGSLQATRDAVGAAYPTGGYAAFLTNHDQDRVFDVIGRDVAAARQAATLLLTDPGVPFIYYGEEIGLRGRKPDERIRTPMPWTGTGPGYGFTAADTPWEDVAEGVDIANVAVQADDPGSLLSHYRALLSLRAAHPALHGGAPWLPLETSDRAVLAALRYDAVSGRSAIVVSNLSDGPVADITVSMPAGPLCGAPTATVLLTSSDGASTGGPGDVPVSPTGGLGTWRIGDLGPHGDLVIGLDP